MIAFGIFGGVILWELSTGLALDNTFRIQHRRPEEPKAYWRVVVGQTTALLCIAAVWYLVR